MQNIKEIRLILGDQLNIQHSWFEEIDAKVLFVLMEIKAESEYVRHHIQKIVGIFKAMRHFADELRQKGHQVVYYHINATQNTQSFKGNLIKLIEQYHPTHLAFQEPDEYRLDQLLREVFTSFDLPFQVHSSEHFYTKRDELATFFEGKKLYLMESFYRNMRKKHQVLMESSSQPISGQWNYDKDNRKKLPKKHIPPPAHLFQHQVDDIVDAIQEMDIPSIGTIDTSSFIWCTTRKEALQLFDYFLDYLYPYFGTYQDALSEHYWSIYHSRISFALNIKLISPKEIVDRAEAYWSKHQEAVSLSQAEGFIRQILGWREYMRGIYWAKMPDYASLNFFNNQGKLPAFFWTGNTKMACMRKAIGQSLKYAYAHHIQRLMVTGNFCSIAGIHPDEVDAWYLGIYIDAFDWVELTNTRGMSQYADGGVVATKPYVSSGAYINKMSDHCANCHYNYKLKTGEKACPFNSLYWHFIQRNEAKLSSNRRMSMMYALWRKMNEDDKIALLNQADDYLEHMEEL